MARRHPYFMLVIMGECFVPTQSREHRNHVDMKQFAPNNTNYKMVKECDKEETKAFLEELKDAHYTKCDEAADALGLTDSQTEAEGLEATAKRNCQIPICEECLDHLRKNDKVPNCMMTLDHEDWNVQMLFGAMNGYCDKILQQNP